MRKVSKKTKKKSDPVPSGKQRLQKILAAAGIDSRRKCEELILEHAVTVNGEVVSELPAFANPDTDDIRVDGQCELEVWPGPRSRECFRRLVGRSCSGEGRGKSYSHDPGCGHRCDGPQAFRSFLSSAS